MAGEETFRSRNMSMAGIGVFILLAVLAWSQDPDADDQKELYEEMREIAERVNKANTTWKASHEGLKVHVISLRMVLGTYASLVIDCPRQV